MTCCAYTLTTGTLTGSPGNVPGNTYVTHVQRNITPTILDEKCISDFLVAQYV